MVDSIFHIPGKNKFCSTWIIHIAASVHFLVDQCLTACHDCLIHSLEITYESGHPPKMRKILNVADLTHNA
jgi:hypothetical protein